MPLFSPVPGPGVGATLGELALQNMLTEAQRQAEEERKRAALARKHIWDRDFAGLLDDLIKTRYKNSKIKNGLIDCRTMPLNPARDFAEELAVLYKEPARRHFGAEFPDDRLKLVKQTWRRAGLDIQARNWNILSYAHGPVLVVPTWRKRGLVYETLLPHQYAVQLDPNDWRGPILGAEWDVFTGENTEPDPRRVCKVSVDRKAWRYFNYKGDPVPGPDGLSVAPHGLTDENGEPLCPAVVARHDIAQDPDWYSASQNSHLFVATLEVNLFWTRLTYVRRTQDSALLYGLGGRKESWPAGQTLGDPEAPIFNFTPEAAAIQFGQLDRNVDPTHALAQIEAEYSFLARSKGIPASSITFNFGGDAPPAIMIRLTAEKRFRLRSEQVEPFADFEKQLHIATAATLKGRPGMGKWPTAKEAAELFEVEFPHVNRIDDPAQVREQDKFDLANALSTPVHLMQRRRPELLFHEAEAELERNAEVIARFNKVLVTHGMQEGEEPEGPAEDQNVQNGRKGPKKRDRSKSSQGKTDPPRRRDGDGDGETDE